MKILFLQSDITFQVANSARLGRFIADKIKGAGFKLTGISFNFCSDAYLLELNRKHKGGDYYTDILTFPLSETEAIEADIYISVDRVQDNGKTYSKGDFEQELHRVIFHGVLHLIGFNDGTKSEKARMRKAEGEWLKEYFKS